MWKNACCIAWRTGTRFFVQSGKLGFKFLYYSPFQRLWLTRRLLLLRKGLHQCLLRCISLTLCWRMLYCQCSWDKAGTLQFLASHLRRLYFESGLQHWTDAEGRLQWGLSRCARGSFLHWRPLSGVYTIPACQGEVFLLPFAIYNPCSGLLWEENLGDNAKGLPDVFWGSLWPSLQRSIRQKLIVLVTSHEATATQRPKLSLRGTLFNTASAVNVTLNRAVTALP